jgi:hypothetical protein
MSCQIERTASQVGTFDMQSPGVARFKGRSLSANSQQVDGLFERARSNRRDLTLVSEYFKRGIY